MVMYNMHMYLDSFFSTEKTERCGKGERVLPTITAASTASRATSYVDAANPTASAVTNATDHCVVRTTRQNSSTQIESTV